MPKSSSGNSLVTLPSAVYASKLFSLGQGYALWYPEPHVTGEVQVGDVGYIDDGAFIRLLNVRAAVPPITYWQTAFENSELLSEEAFRIDVRVNPLSPGNYHSYGVEHTEVHGSADVTVPPASQVGVSFGYTYRADQGALLVLKSQARKEYMIDNKNVRSYILRHHDASCTYARDVLGLYVEPCQIVLVNGWVKTSADWMATAFTQSGGSLHASASGSVANVGGLHLQYSKAYSDSGPRVTRHGAAFSAGDTSTSTTADVTQCVFLRRYAVRKSMWLPSKIEAAAGPPELPDNDDFDGDSRPVCVPERTTDIVLGDDIDSDGAAQLIVDPLETFLEHLLKTSSVDVVLASDNDVDNIGETLIAEYSRPPTDSISLCPMCQLELPFQTSFKDHSCIKLSQSLPTVPPLQHNKHEASIGTENPDTSRLDTPIFMYQLAFPGMPMLLHVFEPKHCLMLRRCLNTPNPCFGMLPPIPPQPNRQGSQAQGGDYGTMLEIRSVQTLPDGRMIVETFGTWRFRVMERGTLDGYIVGRVERVDDDEEDIEDVPGGEELEGEVTEAASASAEPAAGDGRSRPTALSGIAGKRATIEELMATCQTFLEELQAGTPWLVQQLNNYTPMPEDPAIFSFWVALLLPISDHEKVKLLPVRSPHLRLQLVVHWIELLRSNWWFSGCTIS